MSIKNILSKGWWAGIGVIVAIAFQPTYDFLKSLKKTTVSLEHDLSFLKESDNNLNILADSAITLPSKKEHLIKEFTVGNNSKVLIPSDISSLEIKAAVVKIGENAVFEHVPKNGEPVEAGNNGSTARNKCSDGGNGTDGANGINGSSGIAFKIQTIDLFIDDFSVILNGGAASNGGKGGNGGGGGRASRGSACAGGDGGNGGNGGNGGDGGSAGQLTIEYVNAYQGNGEPISRFEVLSYLNFNAVGGKGGEPGGPGSRGGGGLQRGDTFAGFGGQPAGSSGSNGKAGIVGKDGVSTDKPTVNHITEIEE